MVVGFLYTIAAAYPLLKAEITYTVYQKTQSHAINEEIDQCLQSNGNYDLLIPKIGIVAPIKTDVSVSNEKEYFDALKEGIAQAKGSNLPSEEPGNTYLFAHSTQNIFEIQHYSAYFTLLHKLELGDDIYIRYKENTYHYQVSENSVVKSFDLTPLQQDQSLPTLTLQTCDPPGLPINRRIVTAELLEVSPCLIN